MWNDHKRQKPEIPEDAEIEEKQEVMEIQEAGMKKFKTENVPWVPGCTHPEKQDFKKLVYENQMG